MYIPLYVKTEYSLLESLIRVSDLINYCKNNNVNAIAVTDNNLSYVMEFYHAAIDNNIKPIIGFEIRIDGNIILLYATSYKGYLNLIKINSCLMNGAITVDDLIKYHEDIILIVPYESIGILDEIKENVSDLFIGVNQNTLVDEKYSDINKVYINETLCLDKVNTKYLEYLFLIKSGKTLSDEMDYDSSNKALILNPKVDKEVLENTFIIAQRCNFKLPNYTLDLPKYIDNEFEYLKKLALVGLKKRLNNSLNDIYINRLNYELQVIEEMGFANYFLIVYDFIKYAKKTNILVGPGRGSAAGSLVTYSLGITDVDPIKYNLLFERFLNPNRVTMPDIDIDFPDTKRDDVIEYVKNKYLDKSVALILTYNTLGAKQVIRDVAKVLNIPTYKIDALSKITDQSVTLKENLLNNQRFKLMINTDDQLQRLYDISIHLEGLKRHTSIHAAGVVIGSKPLDEIVPLYRSDNQYLTGYVSNYLEELGLLKIDFLGLRNLTIIADIMENINSNAKEEISFNSIPLDDKKTIELFKKADTNGIFQFESAGMKNFLLNMEVSSFHDICAAIALFRPGPSNNIDLFIQRKKGMVEVDYMDPSLKDILEETYGIIVYQEQIMEIARRVANYSLGEADILRRAMSKKKYDVLKGEEDKFISNGIKNGYKREVVENIYQNILAFASYGFNKSHSVAYSLVAYKMAYLKVYYREYFYANLLTSVIGSEVKTKEYIDECRKSFIRILSPNINLSTDKYNVVDGNILYPLSNIKGIGVTMSSAILNTRRDKYFTDIYDFFVRTASSKISRNVIEALIDAGALDIFQYNHQTIYHNLDSLINYGTLCIDIPVDAVLKPEIILKDEFSKDILISAEREALGFYLSHHPVTSYKLKYANVVNLSQIENNFNRIIYTIVIVDSIKEINTKNNQKMAFLRGSDEESAIDYTIFPKIYEMMQQINKCDILLIKGKVEKRFDKYQIIVNDIRKLN